MTMGEPAHSFWTVLDDDRDGGTGATDIVPVIV